MALRLRRGTNAERLLTTPLAGELIYTTDTKLVYVGDSTTVGGTIVTGGSGGSTTLDALTDTDLTGALNNDVLKFNSGTNKWEAAADSVGSLTGSFSGTFDGDVTGSIFGDDSTLIVDGVGNTITIQSLLASTTSTNSVTAEGILDLKSNTNVVRTTATGVKLVSQTVGGEIEQGPVHRTTTSRGTLAAPTTVVVGDSILSILGEGYDGAAYKTQAVINIGVSENTVGTEATPGRIDFSIRDDNGTFNTSFARLESNGVFTAPAIQSLGITTTVKNSLLAKVSGGLGLQGTIVYDTTLAGLSYYHGTDGWNNILTGNKPVETTSFIKPGVYADNTARDAVITTPTAGMMVFNTTGTKFQGYTGSAWVDLN